MCSLVLHSWDGVLTSAPMYNPQACLCARPSVLPVWPSKPSELWLSVQVIILACMLNCGWGQSVHICGEWEEV